MAGHPAVATADVSVILSRPVSVSTVLADYWAMTKPEINLLIVITTGAGFYLAAPAEPSGFPWMSFLHTVLGTLLVASAAATLNQWMEHSFDAKMRRTARRAIAAGRVEPAHALTFGAALMLAGVTYLAVSVGLLASSLALATLIVYLWCYTPLKRVTPLCTVVGAVAGAAPPLIGWAAARGSLDPRAWLLFAIVFLWQFPHFMSIAWMYREDYARAGYLVLPGGEDRDRLVKWQTVSAAAVLMVVGLIPAMIHLSGVASFAGALTLGGIFLHCSARFAMHRTNIAARQLLLVSILYLPAMFALFVLDKT
jgi:protoheme IX farnesyltransferase